MCGGGGVKPCRRLGCSCCWWRLWRRSLPRALLLRGLPRESLSRRWGKEKPVTTDRLGASAAKVLRVAPHSVPLAPSSRGLHTMWPWQGCSAIPSHHPTSCSIWFLILRELLIPPQIALANKQVERGRHPKRKRQRASSERLHAWEGGRSCVTMVTIPHEALAPTAPLAAAGNSSSGGTS